MKSKIGIVCAGDQELAPFLPLVEDCSVSEKAMLKFYSGSIAGMEIVVLYSGVCKTNAAIATQILISSYGCSGIINAGTAGGMAPEIKLFDTVISTETAYWDVAEDILTEFHPWMKTVYFPADPVFLETAEKVVSEGNDTDIYFGRIVSGESFIDDLFRGDINERFSPLGVDMETASIAHVCYVNRIPFLAVRTITDTAEHSGVDEFEQNCDKASKRSADIVKAILGKLSAQWDNASGNSADFAL